MCISFQKILIHFPSFQWHIDYSKRTRQSPFQKDELENIKRISRRTFQMYWDWVKFVFDISSFIIPNCDIFYNIPSSHSKATSREIIEPCSKKKPMLILLLSMYAFSVAHQQSLSDAETFVETIFLIFNPQFLVSFLGCCVLCNKGQVAWLPCSA